MTLTPDQLERFHRDGFLLVEGFAEPGRCAALMGRMAEIVEAFDPEDVRTVFSTLDQRHRDEDYFLSSADRIRFFFEADAFDENGTLVVDKRQSLNKVGHGLHDLDPEFSAFSRAPGLAEAVGQIGLADPRLVQSMYIFKHSRIGGEVVCHQDATFLITEPDSVVGLWFALEDATTENGCLYALPGGHRGPLRKQFRRRDDDLGMRMVTLDETPLPPAGDPAYVPIEAPAGSLVILHGRCPHLSGPNLSNKSRHAYAVHVVDGSLPFPRYNWLRREPGNPARGFH